MPFRTTLFTTGYVSKTKALIFALGEESIAVFVYMKAKYLL